MKNRFLKAAALLCAAAVGLAVFAACGNKGGAGGEDVYYWTQEQYLGADSSDIPSTDLEPWELTAWNANGTGGFGKTESSQDVVSAEIMRVTGLGIDPDTSFDNQGQSVAAALGTIVMGGGKYYPHIAYGTHEIAEIINAEGSYDLVWDLTDYIEKYCPTIVRRMPEYVWSTSQVTGGNTEGRIYGIPYNLGDVGLSTVDPAADPSKTVMFEYLQNYHGCVYVREDILKDAYPEALMTADLDRIYAEQGYFTEEQLFDVHITSAEQFRTEFLPKIAETIAEGYRDGVRLVLISGPSSSGKTTFCKRLQVQLTTNLLHPVGISLDDYFLDREDTPKDEKGDYDFESLYALDLPYFNNDLRRLLAGEEIDLPSFDFETGRRVFKGKKLRMRENSILVIEGIHALNPELTSFIDDARKYRVYVSVLTSISLDSHNWIPTTDNRLLRRIIRDYRFRGYSAEETIRRWPSVRRGEDKWIFPYQENADAMFNSAMLYELAALRKYAEPLLSEVSESSPANAEAYRLLRFLRYFNYIPSEGLPGTSLLREFLGGGSFTY